MTALQLLVWVYAGVAALTAAFGLTVWWVIRQDTTPDGRRYVREFEDEADPIGLTPAGLLTLAALLWPVILVALLVKGTRR